MSTPTHDPTHPHTHIHARKQTRTRMNTYTHEHVHTLTQARSHSCIRTYTHTLIGRLISSDEEEKGGQDYYHQLLPHTLLWFIFLSNTRFRLSCATSACHCRKLLFFRSFFLSSHLLYLILNTLSTLLIQLLFFPPLFLSSHCVHLPSLPSSLPFYSTPYSQHHLTIHTKSQSVGTRSKRRQWGSCRWLHCHQPGTRTFQPKTCSQNTGTKGHDFLCLDHHYFMRTAL